MASPTLRTGCKAFRVAGNQHFDGGHGAGGTVLQPVLKVGEAKGEDGFDDGTTNRDYFDQAS
ncbi:MAG: hypothetical protein EOO62_37990 [Hymenobacter sp.]|nr:MAG: hypothetical protein EOO62_37990 [Hymenobacter sp.]